MTNPSGSSADQDRDSRISRGEWLLLLAGALLIVLVTWKWVRSPLMPGNDFPGEVSFFSSISDMLARWGTIPLWSPYWFNGCSNLFTLSQSGSYPFILPMTHFFGPVTGLKASLVLFHIFSLLSMHIFLKRVYRSGAAAFFGALAYSLFPLHISSGMATGHVVVSMFFALIPLNFLLLTLYLESYTPLRLSALSAMTALTISFDNEKGLIVGMAMALFTLAWSLFPPGSESLKPSLSRFCKTLARAALPAVLGAMLCGFYILPLLFDMGNFALFPLERVASDRMVFSASGLGTFLDRFGSLIEFGGMDKIDILGRFSGFHYVGVLLLWALVFSLGFNLNPRRCLSHDAAITRRGAWVIRILLLLLLVSLALAHGPLSLAQRNGALMSFLPELAARLFKGSIGYGLLFFSGLLSLALIPALTLFALWREGKIRGLALGILFWGVILFCPLLGIVDLVMPLFRNMRSPMWFFNMLGGFCICTLAAGILSVPLSKRARGLLMTIMIFLLLLDVSPYVKVMDMGISMDRLAALENLHTTIARDANSRMESWGFWSYGKDSATVSGAGVPLGRSPGIDRSQPWDWRYLALASYSPVDDLGVKYTGASTPWYWLNWMAPKSTHSLMFNLVLPALYGGGRTQEQSDLLALVLQLSNCPYLVDLSGAAPEFHEDSNFSKLFSVVTNESDQNRDSGQGGARALYDVYSLKKECAPARWFKHIGLYIGGDAGEITALSALVPRSVGLVRSPQKLLQEHRLEYLAKFSLVVVDGDTLEQSDPAYTARCRSALESRFQVIPSQGEWVMTDTPPAFLDQQRAQPLVTLNRSRPGRIEAHVDVVRSGLLTLAESWEPGWSVQVDGGKRGVLRANLAFLGVHVPAGAHKVVFSYDAGARHYLGWALSLAALVTLILLPLCGKGFREHIEEKPDLTKELQS